MTRPIAPCLWFDDNAEEAVEFYVSVFEDSRVLHVDRFSDVGPDPDAPVVFIEFELNGRPFQALNGGPEFTITPAVSFFVTGEDEAEIDALWEALADGGTALMPLDSYPFSDKYGWVQDRFGVSWQLALTGSPQSIIPFLLFVGDQFGQAEEAIGFYTTVFRDASLGELDRYGPGQHEPEGAVALASFTLEGQPFMAMESNQEHRFTFTEATSFSIPCADQEEVDYFWNALTEGGEPSQCGWLKDRYGVSWQVVPRVLNDLLRDPDRERAGRVMRRMLQMTKLDVAELRTAHER